MPRGRKPNVPGVTRASTALPSVRVPDAIAERYATAAMACGESVAHVAREVLIEHAPGAAPKAIAARANKVAMADLLQPVWQRPDYVKEEHAPKGAQSEEGKS